MRSVAVMTTLVMLGCSVHHSSVGGNDAGNNAENDAGNDKTVNLTNNDNDAGVSNNEVPTASDGIKNGTETDIDCGGGNAPACNIGKSCLVHNDCLTDACNYQGKCVESKSCVGQFGGDTCGSGEVGDPNSNHESCCRSLPVSGYVDPTRPNKTVYLDRYEITAGRMRAFVNFVINEMGKPDFKGWVQKHRPAIWNDSWTQFLPSDYEGDSITIDKLLAGDPRHYGQTQDQAGPGIIIPPTTDPTISTGLNHQFNGEVFAELHGSNCGTYDGSFGFPTFWYPDDVLTEVGEVPRANPLDANGNQINAQNALDTKSMNCATNLMFQLFCSFDNAELATSEVLDYITDSPVDRPLNVSGCGVQSDNHGDLLSNILTTSVFVGGRCVDAYSGLANLFFDAGQALPVPGSALNTNFYHYPDLGNSTSDKSWVVAAPGRMTGDIVRVLPSDEGWKDIAGNLTETVLETVNGSFTGKFAIRGRGVGFGSERSDLNTLQLPALVGPTLSIPDTVDQGILRVQRAEVKSGLVGSRCVRFK